MQRRAVCYKFNNRPHDITFQTTAFFFFSHISPSASNFITILSITFIRLTWTLSVTEHQAMRLMCKAFHKSARV